ncbi:MAG TPA: hypothetical protein VJ953_02465 [Saprospiraceae bacterium]|nr:hypothetical protein [Saprospiraceae bacterium]
MTEIKELQTRPRLTENEKLQSSFQRLSQLLEELRKKELPDALIQQINGYIDTANQEKGEPKDLRKTIKKQYSAIVKLIEKEMNLVPKNYYRNMWVGLGMTVFGMPIGLALGSAVGNIGFLAIGLPIGMVIGIAIGTEKDKKAANEGRQLDLEYEL